MAFCLYVAARVFIHVLKKNPNEAEVRSSLEFLLVAMQQFRKVNPLSESFLIQLGLDSQGTGVDFLLQNPSHSTSQSWSSMSTMAKLEVIVSSPNLEIFRSNTYDLLLHRINVIAVLAVRRTLRSKKTNTCTPCTLRQSNRILNPDLQWRLPTTLKPSRSAILSTHYRASKCP